MSGAASVPPDVMAAVKVGRIWLVRGQFGLDDAGLECALLDEINADVAELLANWQGRQRPPEPEAWDLRRAWNPCDPSSPMVPEWMVSVAVEWRRARDRRRRR